jgi:hypothetical protein
MRFEKINIFFYLKKKALVVVNSEVVGLASGK